MGDPLIILYILEKYENDYNIRWISEEDRGQSHAINKGIEMANGEWIGWLNSDDYYLENKFNYIVEKINKKSDLDIIYGDFKFVDENKKLISKRYNTLPSKLIHLYWGPFIGNHCTLFKKSVFDKVGLFDESLDYTMDVDLFWKILDRNFNLFHVPQFIGVRRLHSGAKTVSPSFRDKKKIRKEQEKIEGARPPKDGILGFLFPGIAIFIKLFYFIIEGIHPRYCPSIKWSIEAVFNEYSVAFDKFIKKIRSD